MRFVIFTKQAGIYLGNAMGLGFWSLWDPVGQDHAVTFDDVDEAKAHIASWDQVPPGIEYRPVECAGRYATLAECVASGLPGWDPDARLESAEPEADPSLLN
jgi:hypothetical protein